MKRDGFDRLTDSQIFSLIKEGNQLAFNHVYNKYWKKLFVYANNILNKEELAEDALHEVFTKVWTSRKTLKVSNLQSYLFVSVRNYSITMLSKVRFTEFDEQIIENLALAPEGESNLYCQDLVAEIEEAAKELPARCWEIFFMSRFKGYSNAEIAQHFQISNRTVENQLSIALKHIRSTLSNIRILMLVI